MIKKKNSQIENQTQSSEIIISEKPTLNTKTDISENPTHNSETDISENPAHNSKTDISEKRPQNTKSSEDSEFAAILKARRKELNMTQEDLAKQLHVSRSAVANWESGRNYPDMQLILALSDILSMSLDDLLKGGSSVVKQITEDTVKRKKLSRKVKYLYVIIGILAAAILCILFHSRFQYSVITNKDYIESVTVLNDTITIKADLPSYKSLSDMYYMESTGDEHTLSINIYTEFDLSGSNNEILEIKVDDEVFPNLTELETLYITDEQSNTIAEFSVN